VETCIFREAVSVEEINGLHAFLAGKLDICDADKSVLYSYIEIGSVVCPQYSGRQFFCLIINQLTGKQFKPEWLFIRPQG